MDSLAVKTSCSSMVSFIGFRGLQNILFLLGFFSFLALQLRESFVGIGV